MLNNAPNPSDTGPAPQPNAAAPNFQAPNFPVPGAPAPSYGMPGSYGVVYVPTQPVALRAAMGCAIAVIILAALSSLYMMFWDGVDFDDFSWIGFAAIGGLVIWQLWQGARWAHILVIVDCALYLALNLTGFLLLPFLRQAGVPVLEGARMVGAYHYGDPNVFLVLVLGRTAIDIALHIAIIVLLTRPQVLQYFKAHEDLRSMGVK
ncbi:hypothetical protein [Rothia mucilaginosa]